MGKHALCIGNSDGIGLELTKHLLARDYSVTGISKSKSQIAHEHYQHFIYDVSEAGYEKFLTETLARIPEVDLCVYCAGIVEQFDPNNLAFETKVFRVNLMAAAISTELVVQRMISRNSGHFIGLSSLAGTLTSRQTPAYCAAKAGISKYWESLGLALKNGNVCITNVRLGFVDTKMAKSRVKPFMISAKAAAASILEVIDTPRVRLTKPHRLAWLMWILERRVQLGLFMDPRSRSAKEPR